MMPKRPLAQTTANPQHNTEAPASPRTPAITSQDLFHGTREVIIVHRNEEYRLRITRQEKLILTK